MKTVRQGDILLVEVSGIDVTGLEPAEREGGDVVIAHGEATGHRHRFAGKSTRMFHPWEKSAEPSARIEHARRLIASLPEIPFPADAALIGVVELRKPDALVHEEHDAIPRDAGQLIARRQCTYTPGRIEVVAD
jgi:hypothetical protein